MKFWDSSAIVPLLIEERNSASVGRLYARDAKMMVWWGTETECAAALSRKQFLASEAGRETIEQAFVRLAELGKYWREIAPAADVRATARRVLRTHRLRAADALQLGAALIACGGRAETLEFVCADEELIGAARIEGFRIVEADVARQAIAGAYEIAARLGVIGSDRSAAPRTAATAKNRLRRSIRAKLRR